MSKRDKILVALLIFVGVAIGGTVSWLVFDDEEKDTDYKTKIEGLEKANLELAKEKLTYKFRFDSAQSVIDTVAVKLLLNGKKGKNELAKIDTLSPASRKRYTDSLFARAGIK